MTDSSRRAEAAATVTGGRFQPSMAGNVVVVTGAARGIGAALAIRLSELGARLALVGLEPGELAATASRCGQHARAWHADVTDRERMTQVANEVTSHFRRVDIVVANAGIAIGGPLLTADPDEFDRVIAVNLTGSVATARAFLPHLVASGGYLLQIASLAAMAPAPLMAAYCASKSGVEALAHVLRAELAGHGVDVGVAYLTWTDTDMVRGADADHVLRELRGRLPWPANRTAPLGPAIDRLARGIARRSPHVYAQPWIRALQWLPRGLLTALIVRQGSREVARLADRLDATAAQRLLPVGPGGRAGSARERHNHQKGGPELPLDIRLASVSDLPAIRAVIDAAYAKYRTRMEKPPAPLFRDYGPSVADGNTWVTGDPVTAVLTLYPREEHLYIENVAVDPGAQGQGLGRALMTFAEQEAADRGFRRIALVTHEAMTENQAIYAHLGYVEVERRAEDGYRRIYMQKFLSD